MDNRSIISNQFSDSIPLEISNQNNTDTKSLVGNLILTLALNCLANERAYSYTMEKIQILKDKGISLSNKLPANEIHHVISELELLNLKYKLAEHKETPLAESDIRKQIRDFSSMTEDELHAQEKIFEHEIKQLESQIQIKKKVCDLGEVLESVFKTLPFLCSYEDEIKHQFIFELENEARNLNPNIERAGSILLENLKENTQSLSNKIKQTRQTISSLAMQNNFIMTQEYLEWQTIAIFLDSFQGLLLKKSDFESILNQIDAKVLSSSFRHDLLDQMLSESNHKFWNDCFDELQSIAQKNYGLSLTDAESNEIKYALIKEIKSRDINWKQSTKKFKENWVIPLQKERDGILQKIQIKRQNLNLIEQLWVTEFDQCLVEKAVKLYHVMPAKDFLEAVHDHYLKEYFPASIHGLPQEEFKEYLEGMKEEIKNKIETLWFSTMSSYSKLKNMKTNPAEFVRQLWKKEMGPIEEIEIYSIRQHKINELIKQVVELISSNKPATIKDVEKLEEQIAEMRPEINRLELQELEELMRNDKEIKSEVVDAIMKDWSVIGTRIEYNLSLLDRATKNRIINVAKNRSQLSETIDKVKVDLEHHTITPSLIENKYRDLKRLMKEFPVMEEKQRLNLIVNKAILQQELLKRKAQSYNRGETVENQVLNWFNFKPQATYESLAVNQLIADMMQSAELSETNAERIKKEINDVEYTARLKAAGVAENQIENMKKLINHIKTLKDEMSNLYKVAHETVSLDQFSHLPVIRKQLEYKLASVAREGINYRLMQQATTLIKKEDLSNNTFANNILPSLNLSKLLDSKFKENFKEIVSKKFNRHANFYMKWKDRLAVDAIQGFEDQGEVLGDGVCKAKCLRVGSFEQEHPDLPVTEIGGEKITSLDRYTQARYSKAHDEFEKINKKMSDMALDVLTVPKEVYQRLGYKKSNILATSSDDSSKIECKQDLVDQLCDLATNPKHADVLKKSNGVVYITIIGKDWGHALHCRLDAERGVYRFHDPNIGIFEIRGDSNKINSAKEIAELCKDIIANLYSDMEEFRIYQLCK